MSGDNETTWTDAVPKDRRAFTASEMIECSACSRANPPTRSNCLYCGAALETSGAASLVPVASPIPESEPGNLYHVVAVIAAAPADSSSLSLTTAPREFVPIGNDALFCSFTNAVQAEMTCARLGEAFATVTVEDEQLNLDLSPQELRALEFTHDSMIAVLRR
ncbi:MAG TPA: hypothetical protein VJT71_18885, partial [Pyrinomonadaceae bacterium]|nr:hypothetical protein [Pyrinomonadaceae bacterium]